jgi:hypothetical protein
MYFLGKVTLTNLSLGGPDLVQFPLCVLLVASFARVGGPGLGSQPPCLGFPDAQVLSEHWHPHPFQVAPPNLGDASDGQRDNHVAPAFAASVSGKPSRKAHQLGYNLSWGSNI